MQRMRQELHKTRKVDYYYVQEARSFAALAHLLQLSAQALMLLQVLVRTPGNISFNGQFDLVYSNPYRFGKKISFDLHLVSPLICKKISLDLHQKNLQI